MNFQKPAKLLLSLWILSTIGLTNTWAETNEKAPVIAKIAGGTTSPSNGYPFMVALMDTYSSDPYMSQFCGGTLIDAYWVVTAAHCLVFNDGIDVYPMEPADIEVAVGISDLTNIDASDRMEVDAIFIHPEYNDDTLTNDIALLRLKHPVRNKAPIEIHSSNFPSTNETVRALGWGRTENLDFPYQLMEVDMPVFSRSTFIDLFGEIDPDEYAAGSSNQNIDTCDGDSGGPLLYQVNKAWKLTGITSWGSGGGCDDSSSVGGYTSVRYHVDPFITPTMNNHDPFTTTFTQATPLVENWYYSDWFGNFSNNATFPWIYHQNLGWMYVTNSDADNQFIFKIGDAGLYSTTPEQFPYMYSYSRNSWVYLPLKDNDMRWMYDLKKREWFSLDLESE